MSESLFIDARLRFKILILLFICKSIEASESNSSLSQNSQKLVNFTDFHHEQLNQRVQQISTNASVKFRPNLRPGFIPSLKDDKKQGEILSTNCTAKRNDILIRYRTNSHQPSNDKPAPSGYQKLKPKQETIQLRSSNVSLYGLNNIESEHIPQCTEDGKYEPVQCHKAIGYCWCVNKYGQAIKNSAAVSGEQPICDMTSYESDNVESLVVTGVSTNRIKKLLRESSARSGGTNLGEQLSSDSESSLDILNQSDSSHSSAFGDDFTRGVSASKEPSLSLVPNECTLSRTKARERASKHTDSSIWIPDCDFGNQKLYAEQQCTITHQSRICWCVDQSTGLPLRTSEQLSVQANINCTEVKKKAENFVKINRQKPKSSFYHGFSESCDAHKRSEFVNFLINQFRQQLSDYLKHNPGISPPEGVTSSNPSRLIETQVSVWKFALMDLDHGGSLDDREWSMFKNNFKLVDKLDEVQRSQKLSSGHHSAISPLNILRVQRRCWRDFLEFCGNGDLLIHDSINLQKWLSCTELPSNLRPITHLIDKTRGLNPHLNADSVTAYTKEAAIVRSKTRNPFSGILKPD